MTDVAKAAGVSLSTVDRVLNGRGGVQPDKEQRVFTAARALGIDRALNHSPTRTLRVAVLLQPPRNPFHAALREGIDSAARLYAALNMAFFVHHLDPNDPGEIARTVLRLAVGYDGLIVTSPEESRITSAVREAARRMPVVTLATDLADSGRAAYVGPDDRRAGRVAGGLMGRLLPEGGRIVMVAGLLNIAGHRAREAGFRDIMGEHYPGCELVSVLETGENAAAAARLAAAAFGRDPGLRGLYHTSVGALSIVQELERIGRLAGTAVITHELTPNRLRLLRQRRIGAVIDQGPLLEAQTAVEVMARLLGRLPGEGTSVVTDVQIFIPESV